MDLEFIQDGLKDIGRLRGSILYQSTVTKVIHKELLTRAGVLSLYPSVITVALVKARA